MMDLNFNNEFGILAFQHTLRTAAARLSLSAEAASMSRWREEYLASIHEAESKNDSSKELVAAYSQLVDQITTLRAEKASGSQSSQPSTPAQPDDRKATSRLRVDLAEALRSKNALQARLKTAEEELARLKTKTASDTQAIRTLTTSEKALTRKLRDREDELRQKNKLVADVQDEMAVLNLQLNVAEQERKKAKDEVKVLVDRWMKKMGEEAERMNWANEQ